VVRPAATLTNCSLLTEEKIMSQMQVGRGPRKSIIAESKALYKQPNINDTPKGLARRALTLVRPLICTALVSAVSLFGLSDTVAQDTTLSMAQVRDGASAALLADGQVLIAGGAGPDDIVATAELFGDAPTFTAAAPMNAPRIKYASVVLLNGRVRSSWFAFPAAVAVGADATKAR
jgi:hypothetical protein